MPRKEGGALAAKQVMPWGIAPFRDYKEDFLVALRRAVRERFSYYLYVRLYLYIFNVYCMANSLNKCTFSVIIIISHKRFGAPYCPERR